MFRYTSPSGATIETDDPARQQQLLALAVGAYTVQALAVRLSVSERTAYELIRTGKIAYACAGSKNYRVDEAAVQRYLQGLPPLTAAA